MTITFVLPDLLNTGILLTILASVFSILDGIARSRGKGSTIVGIVEIVVAALILVSVFFNLGIDVPKLTLVIILEVVLIIGLIMRGATKRGSLPVTVIAIVLNSLLLLAMLNFLNLPSIPH